METMTSQLKLEKVFGDVMQEITERVSGIQLIPANAAPSGDLCTVYVAFNRGLDSTLTLCANTSLFVRVAQRMIREEEVTVEDMVDSSKEYFNILCGHIAAALFQSTKVATRFSTPNFCHGRYTPENGREQFALNYSSDQNETVQLIHHASSAE